MKLACICILFLSSSIFLAVCSATNCQVNVFRQCSIKANSFLEHSKKPPSAKHNEVYCKSVQKLVNCLERSVACNGAFIGRYRLLVLQASIMSKKAMCKDLKYTLLQRQTKDLATSLGLNNTLESMEMEPCASSIFRKCALVFSVTMKANPHFCKDFEATIACFSDKRLPKCESLILTKYQKILQKLGISYVIDLAKGHGFCP